MLEDLLNKAKQAIKTVAELPKTITENKDTILKAAEDFNKKYEAEQEKKRQEEERKKQEEEKKRQEEEKKKQEEKKKLLQAFIPDSITTLANKAIDLVKSVPDQINKIAEQKKKEEEQQKEQKKQQEEQRKKEEQQKKETERQEKSKTTLTSMWIDTKEKEVKLKPEVQKEADDYIKTESEKFEAEIQKKIQDYYKNNNVNKTEYEFTKEIEKEIEDFNGSLQQKYIDFLKGKQNILDKENLESLNNTKTWTKVHFKSIYEWLDEDVEYQEKEHDWAFRWSADDVEDTFSYLKYNWEKASKEKKEEFFKNALMFVKRKKSDQYDESKEKEYWDNLTEWFSYGSERTDNNWWAIAGAFFTETAKTFWNFWDIISWTEIGEHKRIEAFPKYLEKLMERDDYKEEIQAILQDNGMELDSEWNYSSHNITDIVKHIWIGNKLNDIENDVIEKVKVAYPDKYKNDSEIKQMIETAMYANVWIASTISLEAEAATYFSTKEDYKNIKKYIENQLQYTVEATVRIANEWKTDFWKSIWIIDIKAFKEYIDKNWTEKEKIVLEELYDDFWDEGITDNVMNYLINEYKNQEWYDTKNFWARWNARVTDEFAQWIDAWQALAYNITDKDFDTALFESNYDNAIKDIKWMMEDPDNYKKSSSYYRSNVSYMWGKIVDTAPEMIASMAIWNAIWAVSDLAFWAANAARAVKVWKDAVAIVNKTKDVAGMVTKYLTTEAAQNAFFAAISYEPYTAADFAFDSFWTIVWWIGEVKEYMRWLNRLKTMWVEETLVRYYYKQVVWESYVKIDDIMKTMSANQIKELWWEIKKWLEALSKSADDFIIQEWFNTHHLNKLNNNIKETFTKMQSTYLDNVKKWLANSADTKLSSYVKKKTTVDVNWQRTTTYEWNFWKLKDDTAKNKFIQNAVYKYSSMRSKALNSLTDRVVHYQKSAKEEAEKIVKSSNFFKLDAKQKEEKIKEVAKWIMKKRMLNDEFALDQLSKLYVKENSMNHDFMEYFITRAEQKNLKKFEKKLSKWKTEIERFQNEMAKKRNPIYEIWFFNYWLKCPGKKSINEMSIDELRMEWNLFEDYMDNQWWKYYIKTKFNLWDNEVLLAQYLKTNKDLSKLWEEKVVNLMESINKMNIDEDEKMLLIDELLNNYKEKEWLRKWEISNTVNEKEMFNSNNEEKILLWVEGKMESDKWELFNYKLEQELWDWTRIYTIEWKNINWQFITKNKINNMKLERTWEFQWEQWLDAKWKRFSFKKTKEPTVLQQAYGNVVWREQILENLKNTREKNKPVKWYNEWKEKNWWLSYRIYEKKNKMKNWDNAVKLLQDNTNISLWNEWEVTFKTWDEVFKWDDRFLVIAELWQSWYVDIEWERFYYNKTKPMTFDLFTKETWWELVWYVAFYKWWVDFKRFHWNRFTEESVELKFNSKNRNVITPKEDKYLNVDQIDKIYSFMTGNNLWKQQREYYQKNKFTASEFFQHVLNDPKKFKQYSWDAGAAILSNSIRDLYTYLSKGNKSKFVETLNKDMKIAEKIKKYKDEYKKINFTDDELATVARMAVEDHKPNISQEWTVIRMLTNNNRSEYKYLTDVEKINFLWFALFWKVPNFTVKPERRERLKRLSYSRKQNLFAHLSWWRIAVENEGVLWHNLFTKLNSYIWADPDNIDDLIKTAIKKAWEERDLVVDCYKRIRNKPEATKWEMLEEIKKHPEVLRLQYFEDREKGMSVVSNNDLDLLLRNYKEINKLQYKSPEEIIDFIRNNKEFTEKFFLTYASLLKEFEDSTSVMQQQLNIAKLKNKIISLYNSTGYEKENLEWISTKYYDHDIYVGFINKEEEELKRIRKMKWMKNVKNKTYWENEELRAMQKVELLSEYIKIKDKEDLTIEDIAAVWNILNNGKMPNQRAQNIYKNIYNTKLVQSEIDSIFEWLKNKITTKKVAIIEYDNNGNPIIKEWYDDSLTKKEIEVTQKYVNKLVEDWNDISRLSQFISDTWVILLNKENLTPVAFTHEWFHQAVDITYWDEAKKVFDNVWAKHEKEIRAYTKSAGYISEDKRLLTEEWLAEKFWVYACGRLVDEWYSFLWFFKKLWLRIQLLFDPEVWEEVLALFDSIYEKKSYKAPVRKENKVISISDIADSIKNRYIYKTKEEFESSNNVFLNNILARLQEDKDTKYDDYLYKREATPVYSSSNKITKRWEEVARQIAEWTYQITVNKKTYDVLFNWENILFKNWDKIEKLKYNFLDALYKDWLTQEDLEIMLDCNNLFDWFIWWYKPVEIAWIKTTINDYYKSIQKIDIENDLDGIIKNINDGKKEFVVNNKDYEYVWWELKLKNGESKVKLYDNIVYPLANEYLSWKNKTLIRKYLTNRVLTKIDYEVLYKTFFDNFELKFLDGNEELKEFYKIYKFNQILPKAEYIKWLSTFTYKSLKEFKREKAVDAIKKILSSDSENKIWFFYDPKHWIWVSFWFKVNKNDKNYTFFWFHLWIDNNVYVSKFIDNNFTEEEKKKIMILSERDSSKKSWKVDKVIVNNVNFLSCPLYFDWVQKWKVAPSLLKDIATLTWVDIVQSKGKVKFRQTIDVDSDINVINKENKEFGNKINEEIKDRVPWVSARKFELKREINNLNKVQVNISITPFRELSKPWKAREIYKSGKIPAYRQFIDWNPNHCFGNPFDTAQKFKDWLWWKDYKNFKQEQREWILNEIKNMETPKEIVTQDYDRESAHILQTLIEYKFQKYWEKKIWIEDKPFDWRNPDRRVRSYISLRWRETMDYMRSGNIKPFKWWDTEYMWHKIVYDDEDINNHPWTPWATNNLNWTIRFSTKNTDWIWNTKAWRNPRRSYPLWYDFKSKEELVQFMILHELAHEYIFNPKGKETLDNLKDLETAVNDEALRVMWVKKILDRRIPGWLEEVKSNDIIKQFTWWEDYTTYKTKNNDYVIRWKDDSMLVLTSIEDTSLIPLLENKFTQHSVLVTWNTKTSFNEFWNSLIVYQTKNTDTGKNVFDDLKLMWADWYTITSWYVENAILAKQIKDWKSFEDIIKRYYIWEDKEKDLNVLNSFLSWIDVDRNKISLDSEIGLAQHVWDTWLMISDWLYKKENVEASVKEIFWDRISNVLASSLPFSMNWIKLWGDNLRNNLFLKRWKWEFFSKDFEKYLKSNRKERKTNWIYTILDLMDKDVSEGFFKITIPWQVVVLPNRGEDSFMNALYMFICQSYKDWFKVLDDTGSFDPSNILKLLSQDENELRNQLLQSVWKFTTDIDPIWFKTELANTTEKIVLLLWILSKPDLYENEYNIVADWLSWRVTGREKMLPLLNALLSGMNIFSVENKGKLINELSKFWYKNFPVKLDDVWFWNQTSLEIKQDLLNNIKWLRLDPSDFIKIFKKNFWNLNYAKAWKLDGIEKFLSMSEDEKKMLIAELIVANISFWESEVKRWIEWWTPGIEKDFMKLFIVKDPSNVKNVLDSQWYSTTVVKTTDFGSTEQLQKFMDDHKSSDEKIIVSSANEAEMASFNEKLWNVMFRKTIPADESVSNKEFLSWVWNKVRVRWRTRSDSWLLKRIVSDKKQKFEKLQEIKKEKLKKEEEKRHAQYLRESNANIRQTDKESREKWFAQRRRRKYLEDMAFKKDLIRKLYNGEITPEQAFNRSLEQWIHWSKAQLYWYDKDIWDEWIEKTMFVPWEYSIAYEIWKQWAANKEEMLDILKKQKSSLGEKIKALRTKYMDGKITQSEYIKWISNTRSKISSIMSQEKYVQELQNEIAKEQREYFVKMNKREKVKNSWMYKWFEKIANVFAENKEWKSLFEEIFKARANWDEIKWDINTWVQIISKKTEPVKEIKMESGLWNEYPYWHITEENAKILWIDPYLITEKRYYPTKEEEEITKTYWEFEIIPYTKATWYKQIETKKNFVIRSDDSYEAFTFDLDIEMNYPEFKKVYRNEEGNIYYYARKSDDELKNELWLKDWETITDVKNRNAVELMDNFEVANSFSNVCSIKKW